MRILAGLAAAWTVVMLMLTARYASQPDVTSSDALGSLGAIWMGGILVFAIIAVALTSGSQR